MILYYGWLTNVWSSNQNAITNAFVHSQWKQSITNVRVFVIVTLLSKQAAEQGYADRLRIAWDKGTHQGFWSVMSARQTRTSLQDLGRSC